MNHAIEEVGCDGLLPLKQRIITGRHKELVFSETLKKSKTMVKLGNGFRLSRAQNKY